MKDVWVHVVSHPCHVSCSCNALYRGWPKSGGGGMQALMCIAKLIKGVAPLQAKLGDAKVTATGGTSTPALQAILQVLTILFELTDLANQPISL